MYAETMRRTFLQIGVFVGAMGLLLALLGVYYVNDTVTVLTSKNVATQRAASLWGGILLICFALRNVMLAFPADRFRSDDLWDKCSAVWTNLCSLIVSGAVVGITLWANIDFFQNAQLDTLHDDNRLVNLIAILLLGVLAMLASLIGSIISCFPVSDAIDSVAPGEQYAMDNHGYNKH